MTDAIWLFKMFFGIAMLLSYITAVFELSWRQESEIAGAAIFVGGISLAGAAWMYFWMGI